MDAGCGSITSGAYTLTVAVRTVASWSVTLTVYAVGEIVTEAGAVYTPPEVTVPPSGCTTAQA